VRVMGFAIIAGVFPSRMTVSEYGDKVNAKLLNSNGF